MTAHDLAADWTLLDGYDGFRVAGVNGTFTRTVWDQAQYIERSSRVQVARLTAGDRGIVECVRYVKPETEILLVNWYRGAHR